MTTVNTLKVMGPLNAGVDQIIASTIISGTAATTYTFSSLAGDTDKEYQLKCKFVNGYAGVATYRAQINADATGYGYQMFSGVATTASAIRVTNETGLILAVASATGQVAQADILVYSVSGVVRTAINARVDSVATTTVAAVRMMGQVYSATASAIASLVILSDNTLGLGVGTTLELWARRGNA